MDRPSIDDALRTHTPQLMAIAGVVGTAQGERDDGSPCILVLVETRSRALEDVVPAMLDGYPVEIFEAGELEAR